MASSLASCKQQVDTLQAQLKTAQEQLLAAQAALKACQEPPPAVVLPVGINDPALRLVFSDEFDGNSLDRSKWRSDGRWNIGTSCLSDQNISVNNGSLHLRALRDSTLCGALWSGATIQTSYTDGPGFQYAYGVLEARVKIPPGLGLWEGVWTCFAQAADKPAELDAAEWLGVDPVGVHATVHYADGSQSGALVGSTNWRDGQWHTMALDWLPGVLVWYVDGVAVRTIQDARVPTGPQFPLLTMAVGGTWGGEPDANTPNPSYFDIDYLRIWQR